MSRIVIGKLGKEEPTSTTDYESHPAEVSEAVELEFEHFGKFKTGFLDGEVAEKLKDRFDWKEFKSKVIAQAQELAELKMSNSAIAANVLSVLEDCRISKIKRQFIEEQLDDLYYQDKKELSSDE